ncbi:DUF4280 domain-containing protein [Taibaiella sp. KBW10]|uniref:DUF4280 domain-containing protein n=1 Tax=Taibaiella sp. KBW10 TaxID=2153357 RepID=UPI000F5ACA67|nr:DUF4280 domain-containing protein [Taibaiella sp. KBW10]RQO29725.1 DUF4280 domain-containing protein [Taibaiella sp. KBW10]
MADASSEHTGKHLVIQKGKACCDKGDQFPQFKVSTHQKHYWNDEAGDAGYLAVTHKDLQFQPSGPSFGKCKLRPSSGGYLPCAYAPAGTWQKTYEPVKVMGNTCLTEISELQCTVGGKITVKDHGQRPEMSKQNVQQADNTTMEQINPLVNMEDFKERTDDTAEYY